MTGTHRSDSGSGKTRKRRAAPTFVDTARRAQITQLTIDLIAEHGVAKTTLARIAQAAGLSNAAVLYFFGTKSAVIEAAFTQVLTQLIDAVGKAIEQAPTPRKGIDAYVRSLVSHMSSHPAHVRVMTEMLITGAIPAQSAGIPRWKPVADLIEQAQRDGDLRTVDARSTAISLNGAVDALFAEYLQDATFDLSGAVDTLLDQFDRANRSARDEN